MSHIHKSHSNETPEVQAYLEQIRSFKKQLKYRAQWFNNFIQRGYRIKNDITDRNASQPESIGITESSDMRETADRNLSQLVLVESTELTEASDVTDSNPIQPKRNIEPTLTTDTNDAVDRNPTRSEPVTIDLTEPNETAEIKAVNNITNSKPQQPETSMIEHKVTTGPGVVLVREIDLNDTKPNSHKELNRAQKRNRRRTKHKQKGINAKKQATKKHS